MDKKWLESEIIARGRGAQAALATYLGMSASVLNKLIRGPRKIGAIEADKIREWLRLHPVVNEAQQEAAAATEAIRAPDAPLPPYRSDMPKDVPVYGTVVGGSVQGAFDFELNGNIVDYVRRPPRIAGRSDVFAAYVQGESMMHWRRPGQLIYVEKAKPPSRLDYVLVELLPASIGGPRPALVKQLLAITPTKIKLRQHNPAKDFEIERRAVLQVYRVMDWDELMGV